MLKNIQLMQRKSVFLEISDNRTEINDNEVKIAPLRTA
jgi:hypothetical protein